MRAGPFGPALVRNKIPVSVAPTRYRIGPGGAPAARDADAQLGAQGTVGVLFQIVGRLAESTAMVDWRLYRKARSGREEDRTEVATHAALTLLRRPNPFYTRFMAMEAVQLTVDLIGEGVLLVTRAGSLPVELWPIRADRVEPVPHPTEFISDWLYHPPDGSKPIPLDARDVLRIKLPNARDPFRGMGPVQSLLADLDSSRYSAEWQRNFFINGAEPGGIIEVPDVLSDEDFDLMTDRWRRQHQGVANAHRVAIIEHGKWVDRKASMADLQIAQLRELPNELIRKAYGFPVAMLGDAGDVNRATALAGKAIFAENLIVPRLERWKELLNTWLLPMFAGGDSLEFDYDDPVPPDAEAINQERDSKVAAARQLIDAGFAPPAVLGALGLPEIEYQGAGSETGMSPEALGNLIQSLYLGTAEKAMITWEEARDIARAAGAPLAENVPPPVVAGPGVAARAERVPYAHLYLNEAEPELADVQRQWERELEALLERWEAVTAAQRDAVLEQIEALVDEYDLVGLAALEAPSDDGAELLAAAMMALATRAAKQQADEASKQGVSVAPAVPAEGEFDAPAAAAAGLLAVGYAAAAGREALRLATPDATARQVRDGVRAFLDDLTDRTLRDQLGGQLTAAQNQGRLATLEAAPAARYFATEELDSNTCAACREVDGREFDTLAEAASVYRNGGYSKCAGRERCRGTVVARWEE